MSTPYIQTKGLPPRRIQKKPRVLSYNKCQFCRDPKVKTKCVWNRGSWPNKCQRCSDKGLPCSEPRHKAEERAATPRKLPELSPPTIHSVYTAPISVRAIPPMLPQLPGLNPLRFSAGPKSNAQPVHKELKRPVLGLSGVRCLHDDPGSSYQTITADHQFHILIEKFVHIPNKERLVLQLLPLHGMILMVLGEIEDLNRKFLGPLISAKTALWGGTYEKAINVLRYEFQQSADHIRRAIDRLTPHSKLAMEAALDLSRFSSLPQLPLGVTVLERSHNDCNVRQVKDRYSRQGHLGMVVLLTMYQSTVETPLSNHEISSMVKDLSNIDAFFVRCARDFEELKQFSSILQALRWFTPVRSIRVLPSLRSRIRKAEFKDFLGRSVPLLEYDAGFPVHGDDIVHDHQDRLGRTLLHVSCVENDEKMLDTLLARRLICNTTTRSGLSPLHIVAITGNFERFKRLHAYYMSTGLLEVALKEPDANGSMLLGIAAIHGHYQIIDLFLSIHKFARQQLQRSHPDSHTSDSFMDQSGKIKYPATDVMFAFKEALRNDRTEVVQTLSFYFKVFMWDEEHRTPLWYASYFGRLFAIDKLFRQDCMDRPDRSGQTPLMAAATAGHEKVLKRLCSLGGCLLDNTKTANRSGVPLNLWRVDNNGKTARDLAVDNGHHECAQFLWVMLEMNQITSQWA